MKRSRVSSYEDLLEDITLGDPVAFSKLYDFFYPSLLQYVVSKVNVQSSAEDILHDLFLSVWMNRSKIQAIESLPAYLYSSCRYLSIEYIRKTSVWNSNQESSDLDLADTETPLEDRLYFRYLLDMVNAEVERLPEKCREIFKLSREQSKSNKEIAASLGISESTVQNQINKALKRLRYITKNMGLLLILIHRI